MSSAASVHREDTPRADVAARVERELERILSASFGPASPPRLRDAVRHAVFGGGARLRPTLCLAVSAACGEPDSEAADAAAAAVELIHCASLVHDDLPCFDDSTLRRGKPTVHAAFGVPTAVLAGDALIVLAFAALPPTTVDLVAVLAEATGPSRGVVAGQAWEGEPKPSLDEYHRAKTASLFEAAAILGARCAGGDAREWRAFGDLVGRAYQAADDVIDAVGSEATCGKTRGRDQALDRPSLVRAYGLTAARRRVVRLVERAAGAIPPSRDDSAVRSWLDRFMARIESSALLSHRLNSE
jgi:geranylgeranyl diphosphate synthase type II